MPFSLFRYALARRYPARPDLPPPSDLKRSYDVVVIGGGGHGVSIAYHLARDWGVRDVCVLEKGYLGGGNTARNTAVIRSNYIAPESVRFYAESVKMFESFSNETGFNMMFSPRGQLTLAHSDAAVRSFRLRAEVGKLHGVPNEILDPKQIGELVPGLNVGMRRYPILAGLWHPTGGTGRHDAVAWGYAARACEMGAELHQRTEVTGMTIDKDRVVSVETNRGIVAAGRVVQAVAGRSSSVAALAGLKLPVKTYPLQAMVTQPVKPFLDTLVSSTAMHCYVSQSSRGEVVIGGGSDPYPLHATRTTLDYKESLIAHCLEMFPGLGEVRLMREWAGITDMTPDYSPIMSATPLANYYVDAGTGTWGFKATPAAGKYMAEMVATGRTPDMLTPFRLDRFDTYDLTNEAGATAAGH